MPVTEIERRLVAAGFINVGVPIHVRYCYKCGKRLVPFRQWHKSIELNQPQKCFCRGCATKLALEIANAGSEVHHCPSQYPGDEQSAGRATSGDPVSETEQDHAQGCGKSSFREQASRAWSGFLSYLSEWY